MGMTIAESWLAEGEARGELRSLRKILRRILTKRFGQLPTALIEKIEAESDLARLQDCTEQAVEIESLDEFQL